MFHLAAQVEQSARCSLRLEYTTCRPALSIPALLYPAPCQIPQHRLQLTPPSLTRAANRGRFG